MTNHLLVTYATRAGSTGEVATLVASVLRDAGASVDLCPIKDVEDLTPYQGVIIGTAVRRGHVLPEAVRFVEKHQADLDRMNTAYFAVCATMTEDTPKHRAAVRGFLEPLCRIKTPVSLGMFAGKLELAKLEPLWRFVYEYVTAAPMAEGDNRDWNAIRAWAEKIAPALVIGETLAVPSATHI
jgi:menaquinone-dependent protoporphyrinogen oxidase